MALSTDDLAGMQQTQQDHMMDTCKILAYSETEDESTNRPIRRYTAGDPLACSFDATKQDEVQVEGEVIITDARIRLPIDTELDSRDLIQMTHRFGTALADPVLETYEIIGNPTQRASALRCFVRLVTDGRHTHG